MRFFRWYLARGERLDAEAEGNLSSGTGRADEQPVDRVLQQDEPRAPSHEVQGRREEENQTATTAKG